MTGPARLAVGAAAGAVLVGAIGAPLVLAAASGGVVAVVLARALSGTGNGRATVVRACGPAVVGALLVCLRAGLAGPPPAPAPLPAGSGPWLAVVESVGSPRDGARPAVITILSEPGVRLAATLPWYPEIVPGDRITLDGTPRAAKAGEYADYLRRIGASGTIQARTLELAHGGGAGVGGVDWEALRRTADAGLQRAIPEPEAGLAAGILVGLRDRVDRELAAAFTTAGVSHIVAISGWNIAIVATTLGALTGGLGRRRRAIATATAIALYVAFVGPSPSVVRAAAMAGCALLARELGRPTQAISAMGLAVVGLLLLDPATVADPGFKLSVLATAGLITWGTQLSRRLAGPAPGRVRAWVAESLGVSLAAQAATLPVILLDFGRLSLVSPAVNLLVAPLVAPAMAAGAAALAAGLVAAAGLPAIMATVVGLPAWVLLGGIVGVVRAAAGLPLASLTLPEPWNVIAATLAAVGILAAPRMARLVGRRPTPRRPRPTQSLHSARRRTAATRTTVAPRLTALLLGAATVAVAAAAIHRPDGATRITVLDVGQGDAILVEGGRGGRLLVDGGPDPGRLLIALDEHLPPWDRRIDAVVLTHPHEDHVAGLALLLERYQVGRVFEPGMIGPGPGYAAWDAELASGGGPTRWALGTGDRLGVDDVALRVLWPDPGTVPEHPADGGTAINNVSVVLLGEVAGHRFLLTGDVEQAIDPQLLARGLPTLDFLKVAHHGSGTASTEPFLDAVRPRIAVVSAGAGNPYGHPAAATIARLEADAGRVFRTDLDGSVTVTFDDAAMRVHAAGGRRAASTASVGGLVAITSGARVGPAAAFLCGVPSGSTLLATTGQPARGGSPVATRLPHPPPPVGLGSGSRYHRGDGPFPGRGGEPAAVARAAAMASPPLARRRGDRRLARGPDRPPGWSRVGRSLARRGCRAPP